MPCCRLCFNEQVIQVNNSHIQRKNDKPKQVIYICQKCYIAFTYPNPILPSYEDLDFHGITKEKDYVTHHLTEITELPFEWRQLIEIQTSFLIYELPEKAKILEIGCGEGILLNEFKKCGFSVTGIEPSSQAFERAKKRDLNIAQGLFPDFNVNGTFNCVVMSQVLEHVYDLNQIITEVKKLIPSGYLMLTQTNFKGLIPSLQKEKWYGWVPDQHFWHFTLKGLTGLLNKYGFERVKYRYSSLVHPHNFLYKLASLNDSWKDQFTVLYKLRKDE